MHLWLECSFWIVYIPLIKLRTQIYLLKIGLSNLCYSKKTSYKIYIICVSNVLSHIFKLSVSSAQTKIIYKNKFIKLLIIKTLSQILHFIFCVLILKCLFWLTSCKYCMVFLISLSNSIKYASKLEFIDTQFFIL